MTDLTTNPPPPPSPIAPPPPAEPAPCQATYVENALLRGSLYLAVAALKRYADAAHAEIDGDEQERLALVVSPDAPVKAADAIERAEKLLRRPDAERGR